MRVFWTDPARRKSLGLIELKDVPIGRKVTGYFGIRGTYMGDGYIQLSFDTSSGSEGEDEYNEWTDEVWRSEIAAGSIVKLRTMNNNKLFGTGKVGGWLNQVEEIKKRIEALKPDLIFINQLKVSNVQKKNLSRYWTFENGDTVKIIDRFEIILQIFGARAKSNLARYELALAYVNHSKSLIGGEGGIPVSLLSSMRNFDIVR